MLILINRLPLLPNDLHPVLIISTLLCKTYFALFQVHNSNYKLEPLISEKQTAINYLTNKFIYDFRLYLALISTTINIIEYLCSLMHIIIKRKGFLLKHSKVLVTVKLK